MPSSRVKNYNTGWRLDGIEWLGIPRESARSVSKYEIENIEGVIWKKYKL